MIIKKDLSIYLLLFFIFFGTILSIDIGFTLKISQVLAVSSLINLSLRFLKDDNDYNKFQILDFFPFLIFILAIIPSLGNPHFYSEFYEKIDPVKLFFNYLVLQLICFSIAFSLNTKEKLKKSLKYIFTGFLCVLSFGYIQQFLYYFDSYEPSNYIGFHQLNVDYYGPFFRFSPATFANEFGEILQTILIFLSLFLYYFKNSVSLIKRNIILVSFIMSSFALILNFTRISWIVLFLFFLWLFSFEKFKILNKILFFISISLLGLLIYYLLSETNIALFISILDRFSELSEFSNTSVGTRLEAWEITKNLFFERPITGHGLGVASETHNVPLQLLAETGFQGLIGFYLLMFYLVHKFYKMIKKTSDIFLKFLSKSLFYSLIGCLIFDLTNHGIYHFILWLIIGLGLATESVIKFNKESFELKS
ncbi:MAG: O-antigen ligase family protein [Candidatus Sericytochromatia bacterium]